MARFRASGRIRAKISRQESLIVRMTTPNAPSSRLPSLDQFRGYTVAGMFFVNFIGGYAATPAIFDHHNTYCSYADTIMPQFFFAVGFAYRLTFLRRLEKDGLGQAIRHSVRRNLGLLLLGIVIYHLDGSFGSWQDWREHGLWGLLGGFRGSMFQTLVHIAVTSLWILPVIGARPVVQFGFLAGSGLLYLALSQWFYYDYVWSNASDSIDGGVLGFMTWTIPTLLGSLAYDAVRSRDSRNAAAYLSVWAVAFMAVGYAISCLSAVHFAQSGAATATEWTRWLIEPPFVAPSRPADIWTMSQKAGSLSYQTFSAGFSLALYVIFVRLSDIGSFQLGIFRTLGQNALAAYIIHDIVIEAVKPFVPNDAPGWFVTIGFAVFFGITYLFMRHLEQHRLYLRL